MQHRVNNVHGAYTQRRCESFQDIVMEIRTAFDQICNLYNGSLKKRHILSNTHLAAAVCTACLYRNNDDQSDKASAVRAKK